MIIEANLVDIEKRKIYPAKIEIKDKKISKIEKTNKRYEQFVLPGFIDSHIHIESSMLPPCEFARAAIPHGTIATVSDPHEIANVMGIKGVEFMINESKKCPFKIYFGAPSCVPATPFDKSGAVLDAKRVESLLKNPDIYYLSEVMNFPAIINKEQDMMQKIKAAKKYNKPIDGHAPGLTGDNLSKYINSGITTDHECFLEKEAIEKIQKGMMAQIREGSAAKNFEALHNLIDKYPDKLMFCSDDKHPNDLIKSHINEIVLKSLKKEHDLFNTLKIACINPVKHYGLDIGLLKKGDSADFIVVNNLEEFKLIKSVIGGETVFDKELKLKQIETTPINNFSCNYKKKDDFLFENNQKEINVIKALDGELITEKTSYKSYEKYLQSDTKKDILKIALINRYENEKPAIAFIKGFGLKRGAIASSVSHDSHNIIAVGVSDEDIKNAVNEVIKNAGAIVAVDKEKIVSLPLKIAGLISNIEAKETARKYEEMVRFVNKELEGTLKAPFMTLSFMALLVIPKLKIGYKGLFDVEKFSFISSAKQN